MRVGSFNDSRSRSVCRSVHTSAAAVAAGLSGGWIGTAPASVGACLPVHHGRRGRLSGCSLLFIISADLCTCGCQSQPLNSVFALKITVKIAFGHC